MFIFLGVATVLVGLSVLLWLPDTVTSAKFLSAEEKLAILHHVEQNQTGAMSKEFKISHVSEAVLDVQFWLLAMITILSSISSGVVTTYSAILISAIGFDPGNAALLNMPSGIVSIAATLTVGFGVRYVAAGHRWLWIVGCCVPGVLGGALMSFLPSDPPRANKAGLLAGIYLINAIVAPLAVVYQWAASNVAGYTKRTFSISLIAGAFSVGNIIGPQTFQARDAPQYIPAKITVLATQCACALSAVALFLYYRWANGRKEKAAAHLTTTHAIDATARENLTDKENIYFRYVY